MKVQENARPPVALGHVRLLVTSVPAAADFYEALGMRRVTRRDDFCTLEMRGGTHLVLRETHEPVTPEVTPAFDLIVDDIDAARADCAAKGMTPSEIAKGSVHRSFDIVDPDGNVITILSSHTKNRVV